MRVRLIGIALCLLNLPSLQAGNPVTYTSADSLEVVKLLACVEDKDASPLFFANKFLGRPYVAHTLEVNGSNENLVVNLRQFDCTTLVETAVALSITAKEKKKGFADFCRNLQNIRYRNGKICGYASRLHYFSQWIDNNSEMRIVEDLGRDGKYPFVARQSIDLHYMTHNPQFYVQLKDDKNELEKIGLYERDASGGEVCYIPKNLLKLGKDKLQVIHDGDVLALVTSVDGLDISHVGIAAWKAGKLHLFNASSLKGKVVLDSKTLYEYQKKRASQLGIRVIRLCH